MPLRCLLILLTCLLGGAILFAADTPPEMLPQVGHTGKIISVDYNQDGSRVATTGDDGLILIWNTVTGLIEHRIPVGVTLDKHPIFRNYLKTYVCAII